MQLSLLLNHLLSSLGLSANFLRALAATADFSSERRMFVVFAIQSKGAMANRFVLSSDRYDLQMESSASAVKSSPGRDRAGRFSDDVDARCAVCLLMDVQTQDKILRDALTSFKKTEC